MAIPMTAEHDNATLSDQTAKALSAALQIGSDVHVLVAGNDRKGAVGADARLSKVLLAQAEELAEPLFEPLATFVVSLVGAHDTIIAPAISSGKNVAPGVAAPLDVISPHASMWPVYTGNPIQPMQSSDATKVISERPTSCSSASQRNAAAVENISAAADPCLSMFIESKLSETDRPDLPRPRLSSPVEARWAPRRGSSRSSCPSRRLGSRMSRQRKRLGQQEVVAPDVCTAVGVSGAISILPAFSAEDFDATVRDTESRVHARAVN